MRERWWTTTILWSPLPNYMDYWTPLSHLWHRPTHHHHPPRKGDSVCVRITSLAFTPFNCKLTHHCCCLCYCCCCWRRDRKRRRTEWWTGFLFSFPHWWDMDHILLVIDNVNIISLKLSLQKCHRIIAPKISLKLSLKKLKLSIQLCDGLNCWRVRQSIGSDRSRGTWKISKVGFPAFEISSQKK